MFDGERIKKAVEEIIAAIGVDPQQEGLRNTPSRVAEMYAEQNMVGFVARKRVGGQVVLPAAFRAPTRYWRRSMTPLCLHASASP